MSKDLITVVAAVIEDDGKYLLVQRKATAVLPLLWEFPGGRVEVGEELEDALQREVKWRVGADIEVLAKLGEHRHEYPHYNVEMVMFKCHIPVGSVPRAVNVNDLVWVESTRLSEYEFPPADERSMDKLLGRICSA